MAYRRRRTRDSIEQPGISNSEIDEQKADANRDNTRRRCSVAAEPIDPSAFEDESHEVIPKSDDERKQIARSINNHIILAAIPEDAKAQMIDYMIKRETTTNEEIITEGEDADNFYVIYSGVFDVFQSVKGDKKLISTYKQEGAFGELALMYNTPRAASVISKTKGVLYYIDRQMFRKFVLKSALKKRKCYEKFLASLPLLSNLSQLERTKLSDALKEREYSDKEKIISQGEVGNEMFFILEGKVKIVRTEEKRDIILKTLVKGDYFGELALITRKPRAAAAYSVGETKLVALHVKSFERLLGPCEVILKKKVEEYEAELKKLKNEHLTNNYH